MGIKNDLYDFCVRRNPNVRSEYERYIQEHLVEHYENRLKHWKILWKLNWHYRIQKKDTPLLYWDNHKPASVPKAPVERKNVSNTNFRKVSENKTGNSNIDNFLYYENDYRRPSTGQFMTQLIDYDVISFDIFDTAVFRKVEKPNDIFTMLAGEMDMNDFLSVRKTAESITRNKKEKQEGSREVTLTEIYDYLGKFYGIAPQWMEREIELELSMSLQNPYIYEIYELLLKLGKTVVFMTDMYLPLSVIEKILDKNGYNVYDRIFLSNTYGLRKGDGTLQKVLLETYPGKKIVHIGDNYEGDYTKSINAGLAAVYNPDSHFIYREGNAEFENMAGSFYRAIIQTKMNCGLWDKDIYYSHGFRVGGILAVGYCQFINQIVKENKIDKILFCARDCNIIYRIYNQFFKNADAEYVNVSRYALYNITTERYLYDLSNRYIIRYFRKYKDSKTIATILEECGFEYLIDKLENNNINRFAFPVSVDEQRFREFILQCSDDIYDHNKKAREAAVKYFSRILGKAENILIVDIGWSGTCISALKYFLESNIQKEISFHIYGTLMCTGREDTVKNSIQYGEFYSYINSPFMNMDITRFIFPGPPVSRDIKRMDKLHMPLEYLFTSTEPSLLSYDFDKDGEIVFRMSNTEIENKDQISSMQSGIFDFSECYCQYTEEYKGKIPVPPYTAFLPLREATRHEHYAYEIYKDFAYDAMTPVMSQERIAYYGELFDSHFAVSKQKDKIEGAKKVLFITPELIYSGAPTSLRRMCRSASALGYTFDVWSAKDGPFADELRKEGADIRIISGSEIRKRENLDKIKTYDIAICNTVMTAEYAEV